MNLEEGMRALEAYPEVGWEEEDPELAYEATWKARPLPRGPVADALAAFAVKKTTASSSSSVATTAAAGILILFNTYCMKEKRL